MDKLVFLLGPAGCAIGMVVCVAMMRRGSRGAATDAVSSPTLTDEVAALRAEVAQLRSETSVDARG